MILCVVLLAFASWFQRRYVDTGWVPGGQPHADPAYRFGAIRARRRVGDVTRTI